MVEQGGVGASETGGFGREALPVVDKDNVSLTWSQILESDPDHEKHLDTREGRFSAALNIVKNGAMVLELFSLEDHAWRSYGEVNRRASFIYGSRLSNTTTTHGHLVKTISTVGAAARSDLDDNEWRRTPFGKALLPAAIFFWQNLLKLEINPAKTLTSMSQVKKDLDGNIVDSSPYARVMILLDVYKLGKTSEVEMMRRRELNHSNILNHLENLKSQELLNFKSADSIDSFVFFNLTPQGQTLSEWPVYIDSRGNKQTRVSKDIELGIVSLTIDGEEITTQNLINWSKDNKLEAGKTAMDYFYVNKVLSFWVRQGLLERGEFSNDERSEISLKDLGIAFMTRAVLPLLSWVEDSSSVPEINNIRRDLLINPESYNDLLRQIGQIFRETSPFVNKDFHAKTLDILKIIESNQGNLTSAGIAIALGVSSTRVRTLLNPLINSGRVIGKERRGGRIYLSVPDSPDPHDSKNPQAKQDL